VPVGVALTVNDGEHGDDRWTDRIIAPELVANADHDRPAARRHRRSIRRSRKWVAQEMQGS